MFSHPPATTPDHPSCGIEQDATLVIGAGFIGRAVTATLLAQDRPVTVVARSPERLAAARIAGAAGTLIGALTADGLTRLIRRHGHVVLAAGGASPALSHGHSAATMHTELELLDVVLMALRAAPAIGMTYLSSGGAVYGDAPIVPTPETCEPAPISDYGFAKLAGEELIRVAHAECGVRARILRVGNAYGPGQPSAGVQGVVGAAFRAAITGEPLTLVDSGRAIRDFVLIEDVVHAIVATMHLPESLTVANVGSGVGTAVAEVVRAVEEVTGLCVSREEAEARPYDVRVSLLDIAALQRRVPYVATALHAGLERTWRSAIDALQGVRGA